MFNLQLIELWNAICIHIYVGKLGKDEINQKQNAAMLNPQQAGYVTFVLSHLENVNMPYNPKEKNKHKNFVTLVHLYINNTYYMQKENPQNISCAISDNSLLKYNVIVQ